jgi:hypothetical protein
MRKPTLRARNPLARYPRLCRLLSRHYSLPAGTVACCVVSYQDTHSPALAAQIAAAVAARHVP